MRRGNGRIWDSSALVRICSGKKKNTSGNERLFFSYLCNTDFRHGDESWCLGELWICPFAAVTDNIGAEGNVQYEGLEWRKQNFFTSTAKRNTGKCNYAFKGIQCFDNQRHWLKMPLKTAPCCYFTISCLCLEQRSEIYWHFQSSVTLANTTSFSTPPLAFSANICPSAQGFLWRNRPRRSSTWGIAQVLLCRDLVFHRKDNCIIKSAPEHSSLPFYVQIPLSVFVRADRSLNQSEIEVRFVRTTTALEVFEAHDVF